jgi:hypothetical protein
MPCLSAIATTFAGSAAAARTNASSSVPGENTTEARASEPDSLRTLFIDRLAERGHGAVRYPHGNVSSSSTTTAPASASSPSGPA